MRVGNLELRDKKIVLWSIDDCTVIALFDNDDDGVSIIHPVGERLLDLNKRDRDNFFKLYERYRNDRRY